MNKIQIINQVLKPIINTGFNAWFVGGCVRDELMGVKPHDFDLCTTARPSDLHKIFDKFSNISENSEKFGITMIVIDNEVVEISTLRKDITSGRHPEIAFADSIDDDAKRRDFTVNALYQEIDGTIIDPTGLGVSDVKNKILRFVGDAQSRIDEDQLRMLRFVRFIASKGFHSAYTKDELSKLKFNFDDCSAERRLAEIEKIFAGKYFVDAIKIILDLRILELLGLDVAERLSKVKQSLKWHAEGSLWQLADGHITKIETDVDVKYIDSSSKFLFHGNAWDHTLRVMIEMSKLIVDVQDEHTRFILMLAALLHDIGKGQCCKEERISDVDFNGVNIHEVIQKQIGHDTVGAKIANCICKDVLRISNDDTKIVTDLIRLHMKMHELVNMKSKMKIWQIVSNPNFDLLVLLAKADSKGSVSIFDVHQSIDDVLKMGKITKLIGLPMPKRIVDGDFLISKGLKPCKEFTAILDKAYKIQIDGNCNDAEKIFAQLGKLK